MYHSSPRNYLMFLEYY